MSHVPGLTPGQRAWRRFCQHKRGFYSLWLFLLLFALSLGAELLSNDRPLVVRYHDQLYFPLLFDYQETTFGGDFDTATDYLDPFIQDQFAGRATLPSMRPIPTATTR